MQSTRATVTSSRGKEQIRGQSNRVSEASIFWFPVYEGIFEHAPIMSDAVWFFMWLIARTTREKDGSGSVLGGIPIHDERPARELGFPIKTVRRWRRMLVSGGYISLVRTPYGFRYTLLKSKKWLKETVRELPKLPISTLESSQIGNRECPQRAERVPETGVSKKTIQGQHKEEAVEETATAASSLKGKNKPKKIHQAWRDLEMEPCGTSRFCGEWEEAWEGGEVGDKMVDLMERAIQSCQAKKIPVPLPFFLAKRRLEGEAKNDDFPTHPVPDRDGPGPPEWDPNEYAKQLNEEMEARWAKEGKLTPPQ